MFKKLDRKHVSELDQFLADFDKTHPEKSAAQQAEINKHADIAEKRDDPDAISQQDMFAD